MGQSATTASADLQWPNVHGASLRRAVEQIQAMKANDANRLEALRRLEQHFDDLPIGTSIIVNLLTGSFVSGSSSVSVLKDFVAEYGSTVEGYMFEVRTPMFVAGGI